MKKLSVILTAGLILAVTLLSAATTVFAVDANARPLQQGTTLPSITFLGEGPGTFTVEPPLKLLVKTYQNGQFLFVEHDELSYTAAEKERVWTIDFLPAEPIRLFHEWRNYGNVSAGCVVNFVQIEDNIDTRRNTFYLNGDPLLVVDQGWVTYGTFTIPENGELTFFAEDSIGMVIELCRNQQTAVPGASPTPTNTTAAPTAVFTATATTAPVFTSTATTAPTATSTVPTAVVELPTVTSTTAPPAATATATATTGASVPTATATTSISVPTATNTVPAVTVLPPAATATATRAPAVILITATPLGTPAAIPVTGGTPGPREVAAVGLGILGVAGLLAAGWWFALRAYRQGR